VALILAIESKENHNPHSINHLRYPLKTRVFSSQRPVADFHASYE